MPSRDIPKLPTQGPLGRAKNYTATLEDLQEGMYAQNEVLNQQTEQLTEMHDTLVDHSTIISELKEIKESVKTFFKGLWWVLSFIGVGGIATIILCVRAAWATLYGQH